MSTGDKNTCTSASSPSTSLIAGIGLAVSAIAQPAVPTKGMVVTPFEQVKFSYRSDKAARESDCCGRKGPGQRPFLDVFGVQERRQPTRRRLRQPHIVCRPDTGYPPLTPSALS